MTAAADWRNPQQTYVNQKDKVKKGLFDDQHDTLRKNRKINELSSNVLTHEDKDFVDQRNQNYNWENKVDKVASNHGWTAQTGH